MVLEQTDEKEDTNVARDVVKNLINNAHEARCTEYARNFLLWDTVEAFNTVAGQQGYSLHQVFDRPLFFYNDTAKFRMREVPSRTLEDENSLTPLTGSTQSFSLWGHNHVLAQPTSASIITVVSDNTNDNGPDYQVTIRGVNTFGEVIAETVSLIGITPATSTSQFVKIFQVTKERVFNGQITVTSNSGTVTNLRLRPDEFSRQYRQIWLHEIPTSAETIKYRFYRKPDYLVNDYDIPNIPAPYSLLLVYDALLQWGAYNTDTQDKNLNLWKEMQTMWERNLASYCKEGQSLGARSRYVRSGNTNYEYDVNIAL